MHLTYKKKIFLYFLLVFSIFTIIIIAVQQNREKTYKADSFKTGMEVYSQVIANYIQNHRLLTNGHIDSLRQVLPLLPQELRVTVINRNGNVLFDNDIDSVHEIGNHLDRPEIIKSLNNGNGSNIRQSVTTGVNYFYYAHFFSPYFVRVAMPYDSSVQNILKADDIFTLPEFKELKTFLENNTPVNPQGNSIPIWQGKISKNGKHFAVKLLIFNDNSYEVLLNNISSSEKNRLLKQEMTNNIAHELKTPVSSIRGYIETILEQNNIAPDKQKFFLERAYTQILRLSDLIRDVALITKTEEASELFTKEDINIHDTINEVATDLDVPLKNAGISLENCVPQEVKIEGNHTLLYSIFRNLIDNTISYAGEKVTIHIEKYTEDNEYYYFSYYDTGRGIEEEHLTRIFDRFYRINPGRSRKNGGSGLGLSIVKNAILFHKGQISAKNRKDGGLEFIFSLRKELLQPSDTAKTSDTPPAQ